MTVKNLILTLLQNSGITQEELANRLEYKSQSNIAVPLSRNEGMGMKVETLIRWVEALDAQIVIQQMSNDEELVLDGEDW